jgi:hypothetical protein
VSSYVQSSELTFAARSVVRVRCFYRDSASENAHHQREDAEWHGFGHMNKNPRTNIFGMRQRRKM